MTTKIARPATTGIPAGTDALTAMAWKVAKAAKEYADKTPDFDLDVMAQLVKKATDDMIESQQAISLSSDMKNWLKGTGAKSLDDFAKTIQDKMTKLRRAGMSAHFSKLSKEDRAKLDPAEFGDPARRLFPIMDQSDVDAASRLIGKAKDPDAVKKRIMGICKKKGFTCPEAWEEAEEAEMSSVTVEFSVDATPTSEQGGYVTLPAPILFRMGNYPDKQFDLTPEEAQFSVLPNFPSSGVEFDLEHRPTVLSGKLGRLTKVQQSANDPWLLSGECQIPKWLHNILGPDDRKLSVTFDRGTKHIVGCGIVRNPRVGDAAMLAAFATEEELSKPAETVAIPAVVVPVTQPTQPTQTAEQVQFAKEKAELQQKLAEEKKKNDAETAGRIAAEAVSFADGEIMANRALARERDHMILEYTIAARDDVRDPSLVQFGTEKMSRTGALRRRYLNREPHKLTKEEIKVQEGTTTTFNRQETPNGTGNTAMTQERKKQLLEMTSVGRHVLASSK